jgi:hypothetical protein
MGCQAMTASLSRTQTVRPREKSNPTLKSTFRKVILIISFRALSLSE